MERTPTRLRRLLRAHGAPPLRLPLRARVMHVCRRISLLGFLAIALAAQGLFFAAPAALSAQATEQSGLSISCEDEVAVMPGEIFTLTCEVIDRTTHDQEGYRVTAGIDYPLYPLEDPDIRVLDEELRSVSDGVYALAVNMLAHRSYALNVNASVRYGHSPVGRVDVSELVNIRVRHHPSYYIGLALLWIQAAVVTVGLIGAFAAAIIDLFLAGRKGLARVLYAVLSVAYSVLVLLPLVYFFSRATGRPLSMSLVRNGYEWLYGFWIGAYVVQFLMIAIYAVIQTQIEAAQSSTWMIPPQAVLVIVMPALLVGAVFVVCMSRYSLTKLRVAYAQHQRSTDLFSGDLVRREYYVPLILALVTWSLAWLAIFAIYRMWEL